MLTIKESLTIATYNLQKAGIESALIDARLLLQHVLDKPREYLILKEQEMLTPEAINQFNDLVARRMNFEPTAYIIGNKEFYGREFFVDKNVLIPRPDTEILIDAVKKQVVDINPLKILDLGSGSGCIIITLLLELPHARGAAVDISPEAIKMIEKNVDKYNLKNRLNLIQSNWFDNLNDSDKFDIIVSNPPYIDQNEVYLMNEEVLKYEPALALFAKEQGLANYITIAYNAKRYLKPGGAIFVEIGFNQACEVKNIFIKNNYMHIKTHQDLAGNDRIMVFKPC